MQHFRKITPGHHRLKRIFLALMLWFTGRAVQAAARVDPEVRREFDQLPCGFVFSLGAFPNGPWMVVEKTREGAVKYRGGRIDARPVDMQMTLKSLQGLFLLFTFQESTPVSNAMDRLFVDGDIPHACTVVRILNIVQVYLLPGFIAKRAIKRYPRWSFRRHTLDRLLVNIRTVAGI